MVTTKNRPGIGVPEQESPCVRVEPNSRYFCFYNGLGKEFVCDSFYDARNSAARLFQCNPDSVIVVGPFQHVK